MSKTLDRLIAPVDQARIVEAIKQAELRTSGEVKVHIEARCPGGDAYQRGTAVFEKLGMTATELRNGVLFYVAIDDHKFALLGDRGIHEAVGAQFWADCAAILRDEFRRGAFAEGLVRAIALVGERLEKHFPRASDDKNELSDDISSDET